MVLTVVSILVLLALLFSGMWIGAALGFAAIIALSREGVGTVFEIAAIQSWAAARSFVLSALPLFILMGEIIFRAGLINRLFTGILKITRGALPGGLLQAVLLATMVFGACSGSSTATAASFGSSTFPVLKKRGYDTKLSTGAIAAGGSLSILIPPSLVFIIFGSLTDVSVSDLFIAGIFPGLLMGGLFMMYIGIRALLNPRLAPQISSGDLLSTQTSLGKEIFSGIGQVLPFIGLIALILGSIYSGLATPTEAAALGVIGALVMAAGFRKLTLKLLGTSGTSAIRITAMMYFVVFAAKTLTVSLAFGGIIPIITRVISAFGNPEAIFIMVVILYLVLGCVLDPMGMLLVTIPFVFPILTAAGYDAIFIGVMVCVLVEIGLLTPPVGFNLFMLSASTGIPLGTITRGSIPFLIIMISAMVLFYFVPQIVLWLPSTMR